jgi:hypothetical protein
LVVSGLQAGFYSLSITDSHFCDIRLFTTIPEPDSISLVIEVNPAFCPGASDGSIHLTTQGGTPGYHWQWATGDTTESLSNLAPGLYQVSVSDVNFCSVMETIPVGMLNPVCSVNHVAGTLDTEACYDALDTIIVAGFDTIFEVASTGVAELIAGKQIRLLSGTRVISGGYLSAVIRPVGPFCVPGKSSSPESSSSHLIIDGEQKCAFVLYPNPGAGKFYLRRKRGDVSEEVMVSVWNIQGVKMKEVRMNTFDQEISLPMAAEGLYLVMVTGSDFREVFRWVNRE